jgi:hypothetical protein
MKIYPSWRFCRDGSSRIVHSESEDLALGSDWAHSPAAFLKEVIEEVKRFDPEVGFSKPVPVSNDPAAPAKPARKRK